MRILLLAFGGDFAKMPPSFVWAAVVPFRDEDPFLASEEMHMMFCSYRKTLMLWPVVVVGLIGALVAWLMPSCAGAVGIVLELAILGTFLLMVYDFPTVMVLVAWVLMIVLGGLIVYLTEMPVGTVCAMYVRSPAGIAITAGIYACIIGLEVLRARTFSSYRLDYGGTLYYGDRVLFQVGKWTRAEATRPDAVEALLIPGYGRLVLSNPRKTPDGADEVVIIEGVRNPEKIADQMNQLAKKLAM